MKDIQIKGDVNMDSFDTRRVLDNALDKIGDPKAWLILAGSVTTMYILKRKGLIKMDSFDTRRTLEKLIDRIGD
jgi:hypothetical protein